jgi:serine-type D-Ala-D-Ala carboxypeptidase (penicillin-binding protein 5/6)
LIARSPVLAHVQPRERRRARIGVRRRRDLAATGVLLLCLALGLATSLGIRAAILALTRPHTLAPAPPIVYLPLRHGDSEPIPSFDLAVYDSAAQPDLGVHARSVLLVDLGSDRVLYAKGAHDRRAQASLTKLMTAMVALDVASPDAMVTVTDGAAAADPTRIGLGAGERLTVQELLYAALMNSANDAAEALGQGLVPRASFLAEMNRHARALHMLDTHFSTPSGLDDPGNYSSAYDLAVLAAQVERSYPELVRIAALRDTAIAATATHKAYYPHNINHILDVYPGADGLKTGFTDDAGGCLIATATRGGHRLLLVLMGSDVMFGDGVRLLDYGFAHDG